MSRFSKDKPVSYLATITEQDRGAGMIANISGLLSLLITTTWHALQRCGCLYSIIFQLRSVILLLQQPSTNQNVMFNVINQWYKTEPHR